MNKQAVKSTILENKDLLVEELMETKQLLEDATLRNDSLATRFNHFSRVVEQGPIAVIITNLDGNIEYVNQKFELITGYTPAEVIGKNTNILKSNKTSKDVYSELWETITAGKEWSGILHNRKKDGSYFWERAIISQTVDHSGEPSHYVAVKEDITAIREYESKLEKEKLKYFHHSKMAEIGMLASSILHEVNNPISAINGLIYEIKELTNNIDNDQKQHIHANIDLILEKTEHLTEITYEISDFTSPHSGGRELVDLNSLVRSTCRLIQFDKRWVNINLVEKLDNQLPAIFAIKDQLTHLILNLLVNAADAVEQNENRQPTIAITTTKIGEQILLSIIDNGCGIKRDTQQHVFEAFYTTKPPGKGTGLGLSLCNSIAETHNGIIEIDSAVNKGTEMRIILPIGTNFTD